MRLRRVIAIVVLAQVLVFAVAVALTYADYRSERERLILGDLLTLRFMTLGKEFDHSFRRGFFDPNLDLIATLKAGEKPAASQPDFLKTSERTVEIVLADEMNEKTSPELKDIFNSSQNVVIMDNGGKMTVATKLYREGTKAPYGVARIVNMPRGLLGRVVRRNSILYFIIFLLINGQVALYITLVTRRREVMFKKGYLKEHALGALKLQHKILGDIIADHEDSAPSEGESEKVFKIPEKSG